MNNKGLVSVIISVIFIGLALCNFSVSAEFKTSSQMIRMPTISDCLENVESMDTCMNFARPEKTEDCARIPNNLAEYGSVLVNCYSRAMHFDPVACEKLISVEDMDQCYDQANICPNISSQDLKNSCSQRVEQIRKSELVSMFWQIFGVVLYFGSLIGAIVVVIKTWVDYSKKKISLLKRIILIIFLLLIWFLTAVIAGLPPFAFRIVY